METIKIELTSIQLQAAIEKAFENILKSEYSNPVKDAVEKAIKEKDGEISIFVKQIIANSLADPKFKEKMGEIVMAKMVESMMKK